MKQPLRILVVEDDPVVAETIKVLLDNDKALGGFEHETVTTLKDAEARLERGGIDAVLLDLMLPDAEEAEALEALRSKWLYLPIVVLTGIGPERWLEMIEAGACDFFAKGEFSAGLLTESIRKSVIRRGLLKKFAPAHASIERTGVAISEAKEELAVATGHTRPVKVTL